LKIFALPIVLPLTLVIQFSYMQDVIISFFCSKVLPLWLLVFCAVSKQINDKERVAAALENPSLLSLVNECISDAEYR